MVQQVFGPTLLAAEKLQVNPAETREDTRSELMRRIAEQVRADSKERGVPSNEQAVQQVAPDLPRAELSALLDEMAAQEAHRDIKAVVAPTGRIYLFSETHLSAEKAAEKCFEEEVKYAIVTRIRKDSRFVVLTPLGELDELLPWPEPEKRAALLDELLADERFRDIQKVTGPGGEVCFHSDTCLSASYGKIMMRARTKDAGYAIAELVRDRSRMPAPTKITVFEDRVFGLSRDQVQAFVEMLAQPRPDYADIKKLVHPTTGAVYLYSAERMHELTAYRMMDWEEVGASQNP